MIPKLWNGVFQLVKLFHRQVSLIRSRKAFALTSPLVVFTLHPMIICKHKQGGAFVGKGRNETSEKYQRGTKKQKKKDEKGQRGKVDLILWRPTEECFHH